MTADKSALEKQLLDANRAKVELESRIASVAIEQGVWGTTRDSVQQQLSNAFKQVDEAKTELVIAVHRAETAEREQDQLCQRIASLESKLDEIVVDSNISSTDGSATAMMKYPVDNNEKKVEKDTEELTVIKEQLRQAEALIANTTAQLRVLECELRIEQGKARQLLRQSSAQLALLKAEADECRMMSNIYRY